MVRNDVFGYERAFFINHLQHYLNDLKKNSFSKNHPSRYITRIHFQERKNTNFNHTNANFNEPTKTEIFCEK